MTVPDLPEDLPETPARGGDHPRLTDAQLAAFEPSGVRIPVARGDVLYRVGDDSYDLHVVLSGAVAVVGFPENGGEPLVRVHGPRRFLGEPDLFDDEPVRRTAVVVRPGEVLRLPADRFRAVLDGDHELRELVTRAFLVRRAIRYELDADLRILGRRDSPEVRRLLRHAHAHGLTTDVVDIGEDGEGQELLTYLGAPPGELPIVVARSGRVLHNPTEEDLEHAL